VPRVLVIHYNPAEAAERAGRLRQLGFDARPYLSLGTRGFREIRADLPDVILIDLTRMPSYGKAMGALMRETKWLRAIPLAFVTGDPAKTAVVREILPDAVFAAWDRIGPAIERAVARPPKAPATPRVAVRSLPAKLGIQENSVVALVNAPEGFTVPGSGSHKPKDADVVLLFVKSAPVLARELPVLARGIKKGCRLWIVWPKKASGVKSDLTLMRIWEMANQYGLTGSKVCAIDATWSGLALGERRGHIAS